MLAFTRLILFCACMVFIQFKLSYTLLHYGMIEKVSYPELMKWFKLTSDWKMIATFLLPESTAAVDIAVIEDENQGKVRRCQMDLAKRYTENSTVEVSWHRVYQAFVDSDHPNIAEEIRQEYLLK